MEGLGWGEQELRGVGGSDGKRQEKWRKSRLTAVRKQWPKMELYMRERRWIIPSTMFKHLTMQKQHIKKTSLFRMVAVFLLFCSCWFSNVHRWVGSSWALIRERERKLSSAHPNNVLPPNYELFGVVFDAVGISEKLLCRELKVNIWNNDWIFHFLVVREQWEYDGLGEYPKSMLNRNNRC